MAVTVTCQAVNKFPDGRVLFQFSDGTGVEFPTFAEFVAWAKELESADSAKRLLAGWWTARSPEGSNVNLVVGKALTFDLSAANAIRVQ